MWNGKKSNAYKTPFKVKIVENFEFVNQPVPVHHELVSTKALVLTDSVPKITTESAFPSLLSKQLCLICRLLVCQSLISYDLSNFGMSPVFHVVWLEPIGHPNHPPPFPVPQPKIRLLVLFVKNIHSRWRCRLAVMERKSQPPH